MNKNNIILLLIITFVINCNSQESPQGKEVSLLELITNPKKHYGKKVTVKGYLSLNFELEGLYLNDVDAKNEIFKNAIGIVGLNKFNSKYVIVSGTFTENLVSDIYIKSMKKRGIKVIPHNLYVGYLKNITFVELLDNWNK